MKKSSNPIPKAIRQLQPLVRGALVVLVISGYGCVGSGPSDPELEFVNPLLADIRIFHHRFIDGVFIVHAVHVDPSYVIPEHGRLTIEVSTARGEAEQVILRPRICGNGYQSCTRFSFITKSEYQAVDVIALINELPAWFSWQASSIPQIAFAEVLSGSSLSSFDAVQIVEEWSEVESAEVGSVSTFEGGPPGQMFDGLALLDFTDPVPEDGQIQVLAGDTLLVAYQQPDGTILSREVLVTCNEPGASVIPRPPVIPTCR